MGLKLIYLLHPVGIPLIASTPARKPAVKPEPAAKPEPEPAAAIPAPPEQTPVVEPEPEAKPEPVSVSPAPPPEITPEPATENGGEIERLRRVLDEETETPEEPA